MEGFLEKSCELGNLWLREVHFIVAWLGGGREVVGRRKRGRLSERLVREGEELERKASDEGVVVFFDGFICVFRFEELEKSDVALEGHVERTYVFFEELVDGFWRVEGERSSNH